MKIVPVFKRYIVCLLIGLVAFFAAYWLTPHVILWSNEQRTGHKLPLISRSQASLPADPVLARLWKCGDDQSALLATARELLRTHPRQVMDFLFHEVPQAQATALVEALAADLLALPDDQLLASLAGVRTQEELRHVWKHLMLQCVKTDPDRMATLARAAPQLSGAGRAAGAAIATVTQTPADLQKWLASGIPYEWIVSNGEAFAKLGATNVLEAIEATRTGKWSMENLNTFAAGFLLKLPESEQIGTLSKIAVIYLRDRHGSRTRSPASAMAKELPTAALAAWLRSMPEGFVRQQQLKGILSENAMHRKLEKEFDLSSTGQSAQFAPTQREGLDFISGTKESKPADTASWLMQIEDDEKRKYARNGVVIGLLMKEGPEGAVAHVAGMMDSNAAEARASLLSMLEVMPKGWAERVDAQALSTRIGPFTVELADKLAESNAPDLTALAARLRASNK